MSRLVLSIEGAIHVRLMLTDVSLSSQFVPHHGSIHVRLHGHIVTEKSSLLLSNFTGMKVREVSSDGNKIMKFHNGAKSSSMVSACK